MNISSAIRCISSAIRCKEGSDRNQLIEQIRQALPWQEFNVHVEPAVFDQNVIALNGTGNADFQTMSQACLIAKRITGVF